METAYLHLITNHIPIIGVPFAVALLLFGVWRRSNELKIAALLAFVVIGLMTVGVYLLGQGGEDFVEDLAGVSHDAIEDHEEAANVALASLLLLAAVSTFSLVRYRLMSSALPEDQTSAAFPVWIMAVILAIAIASAAVLGYTGRLGGKIRHTEFHDASVQDVDSDEEKGDAEGRRRGRNRGGR